MEFLLSIFTGFLIINDNITTKCNKIFIESTSYVHKLCIFFQKYERFVDKSAKVLLAETVALTSDRMFVETRYKSLYMETYMVKQIISRPIKLFTLPEIFICKQRNNKILTWYWRRNDTFFCANRPLTGVIITFIRCLYRVTGVSTGQGVVETRLTTEKLLKGHNSGKNQSSMFSIKYAHLQVMGTKLESFIKIPCKL